MPEVAGRQDSWRQGLTLVCNLYSLNKKRDMLAASFVCRTTAQLSSIPCRRSFRATSRPWCARLPTASAKSS